MLRHAVASVNGTIRNIILDKTKYILKTTGKLLLKNSPDRANEIERRKQARPKDGIHWFVPEEAFLLEALTSLIVPSDDETPGVNEMDVLGLSAVKVIEQMVVGSKERQSLYTEGLIVIDEFAERLFKSKYLELSISKQVDLLKALDISDQIHSISDTTTGKLRKKILLLRHMKNGLFPAVELFPTLVQDVLEAFYTSEVSWVWLGYDGPPMPHGYADLHVPRPRKGISGGGTLRDLAASGYGISIPHIAPIKGMIDVVVIGSGAGGGVVAKELAEAGLSVVVIEAGKRFNPLADYLTDRTDFESKSGKIFDPDDNRRDLYTVTGTRGFMYGRVKGVGGSTLKYVACKPRFHESDFRVRTEDGVAENWPITYEDLEPFYTRVEYELGVSGPSGPEANPFEPPRSKPFPTPPHRFNLAGLAIKRGADKLGLHMVREPLGMPTVDWNDRPACINAGTCSLGCAITAKSSMDVTYLRKAEKTGRVEIRSQCMARRITVSHESKAQGVIYLDSKGREHEIRARAIVLAGNAVETPRLLFMSKSGQFPNGLANSSGLVGKYFTEHLAVFAYGLFPERLDPWRGTPTGGMIQDNYATNKANAFARGWTTYVMCSEHWPLMVAKLTPGWGAEHKRRTNQLFSHIVGLSSVGEQLPDIHNKVTLDPDVKDSFGLPVPRLTNELGRNDREMIKAIHERFKEILEAAGATEILGNNFIPGGSSHYLGTCRMGRNSQSSVVNEWGRSHDVPNLYIADSSVFVTGAAVNPSLTISALATRTAAGIVKDLKKGDI